ncbi:fasciclin domain-containing protein [Roseateles sp. BYS96W]|uniref:Fasciclin domain-containing protein n=1 Tax=Pelomonas nitida TaxID=3299027 RepID=A0ABW7G7K9_9BURK
MIRFSPALALTAAAFLTACATTPAPAPLAETLARDPQLTTFNRLAAESGLAEELRAAGPLTIFVPSDDAFKAVPSKTMEALAADPAQLKAVLGYHVIDGRVIAADVKPGATKTHQGASLALAKAGSFVTVDDAVVQRADIEASNGVAHVVDRVLMPPKK